MESLAPHISKRLAVFSGVKQPPTEKYLAYLIQLRFRRSS